MANKGIGFLMIFSVILLISIYPVGAADISVNSFSQSPGAGGDCTLGEAIEAANTDTAVDGCPAGSGNDSIYLPSGTYPLTTADNTAHGDNGLPDITSNITIIVTGSDPAATWITRGVAAPSFRIFHIAVSGTLSLNNLTIDNGEANATYIGGAILNHQGTLNISNCQIFNNVADTGGGISNVMGTATLEESYLAHNRAITDTGGGIYNSAGTVNITNSLIVENSATGVNSDGGGIYSAGTGTVNIFSSTIANNSANDTGGGLFNSDGTANISATTFSDNHALNGAGGGIASGSEFMQATLNISNSTFSGNSAATLAGGIGSLGSLTATNITIFGNSSDNIGGGMVIDGPVSLKNSIVAGNTAVSMGPDCAGDITTALYNLIGNNADCTISSGTGNLLNVNPQVGPLQDNGGPTLTHALLAGSPAIDAGTNNGVSAEDQRGFPRISNGTVDIGAYEFQAQPIPTIHTIPTMGEWGMVIMSMLLAGVAIWMIKRHRKAMI